MRILYWPGGILLGVVLVTIAVLAIAVGYTAACPDAASSPPGADVMRAVKYQCYGSPEVLQVVATARPEPAADAVLVRVRAASVNPMDWHDSRGSHYFMRRMSGICRPADTRLGTDFAGGVESVGAEVSEFKPGDPVFGGAAGAFGEFVVRAADRSIAHMPPGISFAEAAAIPVAAITALQALRESGNVQAVQRVLINGATGGVGGYAVQIARSMGATVTGVCSTRNVERVLALGADRGSVLQLVLREGLRLAIIGTVIGLAGALATARLVRGLLYNSAAIDPSAFTAVPLTLLGVAALAVYLPARRAARVDPIGALKSE